MMSQDLPVVRRIECVNPFKLKCDGLVHRLHLDLGQSEILQARQAIRGTLYILGSR